jgi:hypothetical protein
MTDRVRYTFEQPTSIGFISPKVFENLANLNPSAQGGLNWSWNWGRLGSYSDRGKVLESVTHQLEEYVTSELNKSPRAIAYDFDNRPAQPGSTQRGIGWHVDGGKAAYIMTASSAIPTEFLIGNDPSPDAGYRRKELLNELADEPNAMFSTEAIETGMSEGVFKIYQPEPFEAVVMTQNIHRSTKNISKVAIERTFLRGWIHAK